MAQLNTFEQAEQQYPIIKKSGVVGIISPQQSDDLLEFYLPGEAGTQDAPRPKELPLDKPGVQIYNDKTTPLDVLGDVTSHYLVDTDPKIKKYYQDFAGSLTPEQHSLLQEQFVWAQNHENEQRSYEDWLKASGLPAYFRGYAFKQWPDDFNEKAYTPDQRKMFDEMMQYLQGSQTDSLDILRKNEQNKTSVKSLRKAVPNGDAQ